jgi:hypothetical protein
MPSPPKSARRRKVTRKGPSPPKVLPEWDVKEKALKSLDRFLDEAEHNLPHKKGEFGFSAKYHGPDEGGRRTKRRRSTRRSKRSSHKRKTKRY